MQPMGSAWLSWHHYHFTIDQDFLKDTADPLLTDMAAFYQCYTFDYAGFKVTRPSLSPETNLIVPDDFTEPGSKVAVDIAPAMDSQLIVEVFDNLIEVGGILGIDDDVISAATDFLPIIKPQQIDSLGHILEWRIEYKQSAVGHRWTEAPFSSVGSHARTTIQPVTQ